MAPLLIGIALALGALVYVLAPIVGPRRSGRHGAPPELRNWSSAGVGHSLDEIELDRATGKLSEDDFHALRRAIMTERMPRADAQAASTTPDEAEALIARVRSEMAACPACGARREPAARYCSSCGQPLS